VTPSVITALYVPGDRPDRFDKAASSGAQAVFLDLEDAVAPAAKTTARAAVTSWLLDAPRGVDVQVRVNAGDDDDVAAVGRVAAAGVAIGVRVPKVETPADLDRFVAAIPGVPLTALLETARGIEAALSIAAHRAVVAVGIGEADLASDVGSSDDTVLDYARTRVLYAARANGLPAPMMSVYPAIADLDGLRRDTERGRDRGYVGRAAVHPSQLPVIAAAFRPAEDDLRWARDVIAAMSPGGVTRLPGGEMVDPAMRRRAEAILALGEATAG
jgi:citrate lyase subunit beta / citryl-CoA lyase